MRASQVIAAAAALFMVATSQAWAGNVALSPVVFSPELQTKLENELGAREGDVLTQAVERALASALSHRGDTVSAGAPVVIDVTIVDAAPNRPTFEQLNDRPGLDPLRSISIGGAELHAVLRTPDGQVLREISHRRYDHSINEMFGGESTWTAARRAIRQFAEKVADASAEQSR